jgi:hypothetical protein
MPWCRAFRGFFWQPAGCVQPTDVLFVFTHILLKLKFKSSFTISLDVWLLLNSAAPSHVESVAGPEQTIQGRALSRACALTVVP